MTTYPVYLLTLLLAISARDSKQEDLVADAIQYYLYTRENAESSITLTSSNLEGINPSNDIVFLVHGYIENRYALWYEPLNNALLNTSDVNVIEVSYVLLSYLPYPTLVDLTDDLGDAIGDFIIDISNSLNVDYDKFNLIGHSLGGQIVGFIGKRIINQTDSTVKKIVGLDPAGPFFSGEYRLLQTDAEIVEVIHTDGNVFGYFDPTGTVDFYPNGGVPIQPGCGLDIVACDHHRSYEIYIEAVQSGGFTGTQCSSWDNFRIGLCSGNKKLKIGNVTANDSGSYYLYTNGVSPFSIN